MGVVSTLNRRRLTDAELLRTEFLYRDPENIEGLNRNVPDPEADPLIIGYYNETPPGGKKANRNAPMIRCCHCGRRVHWKGYVVRDSHGETYIIGARNCGREHYGGRFEAEERSFRQEQVRKNALSRWRNMMKLVQPMADEVEALLSLDALRIIERKRDEVRRASPEGFGHLIRHHGSGSPMMEVKEFRDHEAEARREERYRLAVRAFAKLPTRERRSRIDQGLEPQQETDPIFVRKSTPLGPLTGAGFLTEAGDVRAAALEVRETLLAIRAVNKAGTETARLNELTRLLREMTDRPQRIWDAQLEVSFVSIFFEPQNLERIERWSSSFARFSYQQDEGALLVNDSSRGRTRIAALGRTDLIATPAIDSLRYVDEDFLPMMVEAA
jgi:hypothetical protein